jgi:hypothetical protein
VTDPDPLVAELLTLAVAVSARRRARRATWRADARRMAAIIRHLAASWADAQQVSDA